MIGWLRFVGIGAACLAMVAVVPGALAAPPVPPGQHHAFGDVPQAAVATQDEALPAAPFNPYTPPACTGLFADVACPGGFAVNWIEKFYNDGITAGCGTNPLRYCPSTPVTRDQMAVFVEKAMRGTGTWSPGDLGNSNTGLGAGALLNNSAYVWGNTAVGWGALQTQSFTNGNVPVTAGNTAIGDNTLYYNQPDGGNSGLNGTFNTAVGLEALVLNTTGYGNTAIGQDAGADLPTGSWNTFVGAGTDVNDIISYTNSTAIGHGAIIDASNKVRIGNTNVTVIEGQVAFTWPSDARLKENIRDLDLGLDFVMQLRPVSFTMKQGNGRTDLGFIAQDVEALLGDGYNVLGIGGDRNRTLSLRGTDLIAPLVKAVQEQQGTIEKQKTDNAALKAQVATQQAQIDALQGAVTALEARLAPK